MPEYKDYFLNLEDVEKHNSFIGRKPNMAELPDFESNKDKLPDHARISGPVLTGSRR